MNQEVSRSEYSQSERLIQIGAYLQQVREEQGLSIEQVATKTIIPSRILKAIESGNLDILPEAIYVRGFIKRYADFLGLNGKDVSSSFPLFPDARPMEPTWQNSDVAQLRQTHLYLAYVALITVAVIGLGAVVTRLSNGDRPGSPNTTIESSLPASTSSTSSQPEEPSTPSGGDSNADTIDDSSGVSDLTTILNPIGLDGDSSSELLDPSLADKPIRVELEVKARSWLRITVDGRQDFEGVLPEGTQRIWAGDEDVVVRAGNAGGVLVALNGAEAEVLGEPGAVQEKRFSADDISSSQSR
ncbi:MAG: helix-turn-helix domain-containing protein [Merismopedia sp. SIO2A8]|nr:helix-turn-helix domain-containing protein [Symploca sp. SIO2B6]NET48608.1 helix-turn-helix domain-containing protein [Merismopedia sp. SIO2A8]